MTMTKTGRLIALAVALMLLLTASAQAELKISDTDYQDRAHWLLYDEAGDKPFDVFALYPTVTFSTDEEDLPFVRIDSEVMRGAAAGWAAENAPLIESGNVYVPLYRQLNSAALMELDAAGFLSHTTATPRDDVFAAFDYFLREINKGERPFILFGHSQGAQLISEVATVMLGDERYSAYNALHIATYAIGCSVTQQEIARNPQLAFGASAIDTGVILSWNTTAPSEIGSGSYKGFGTWKEGALIINPVSWTVEELLAHAEDNPLSRAPGADGQMEDREHFANAIVDGEHNVLVVTSVDESMFDSGLPISKFHKYDLSFFYGSIRQNIVDRAAAFLAASQLNSAA